MEEKVRKKLESAIHRVCSYCEGVLCDRCEDCPVYKMYEELFGGRI